MVKMKGFIRLLEVILAFAVLFTVLNKVQLTTPPRYDDPHNLERLVRIARDYTNVLCYNEQYRHDLVEGLLPFNLTRRADAWNKSYTTESWQTSSNVEKTIRQITYFNESGNVVKICIETNGSVPEASASICEQETGANCTSGTLSQVVKIPQTTGPAETCSDFFNYNYSRFKTYLVVVYFPDFDYVKTVDTSINGYYEKTGVNETALEKVNGYADKTNTEAVKLSVYSFHDANFSMLKDVGYHVWLYSNSSNDFKLDDLINETGENTSKPIGTESCIIYGYLKTYSPKKVVVGVWNK